MDWTLEVVVVPVSTHDGGVDRAIAFYRDQLGFALDHHTHVGEMVGIRNRMGLSPF